MIFWTDVVSDTVNSSGSVMLSLLIDSLKQIISMFLSFSMLLSLKVIIDEKNLIVGTVRIWNVN